MPSADKRPRASPIAVWLATAGGVGRSPTAPGTAGSLIGLLLGLLTAGSLGPRTAWVIALLSFAASAWCCTQAERALQRHDPPAVVLDEVWGMWAAMAALPPGASWAAPLAAFGLFRVFDTLKPPPLRWLARLPAGWGIMADDAGAAVYTIGILHVAQWLTGTVVQ